MSYRAVCQDIKKNLPPKKQITKLVNRKSKLEFHSTEELLQNLRNYGPVVQTNLEGISSGESSPCISDDEKNKSRPKRKKDLSLYDILESYLDSSSVEELFSDHPAPYEFDWVIIMGFVDDTQVTQARETLNNECKAKIQDARLVYYKGFRSCLCQCMTYEDARLLLNFIYTRPVISQPSPTALTGIQLRSKFKDLEFESAYNSIMVKNVPAHFTPETFKQFIGFVCPNIVIKSVDQMTMIANTIVTVIGLFSLEEAEIVCQKLNNKTLQLSFKIQAALVLKQQFKHRNKQNSIFNEYLVDSKKLPAKTVTNSNLLNKRKSRQVKEIKTGQNCLNELSELFRIKPALQPNEPASNLQTIRESNSSSTSLNESLTQNSWQPGVPFALSNSHQGTASSHSMLQAPRTVNFGLFEHLLMGYPIICHQKKALLDQLLSSYALNAYSYPSFPHYPMMPMNFYSNFPFIQGNTQPNDFNQNFRLPELHSGAKLHTLNESNELTGSGIEITKKKIFAEDGQIFVSHEQIQSEAVIETRKKK